MLCLSTTKEPRIAFISWFFEESRIAARAIISRSDFRLASLLPVGSFSAMSFPSRYDSRVPHHCSHAISN